VRCRLCTNMGTTWTLVADGKSAADRDGDTVQDSISLGPALNQLSLMMPLAYSSIETSNRIHPSWSSLFVKKINLFAFSNRSQCNKERAAAHFIHYIRRCVVNHYRGKRFGSRNWRSGCYKPDIETEHTWTNFLIKNVPFVWRIPVVFF
jgi:hypothetical protein